MTKTIDSSSTEKLQLNVIFGMVVVYGLLVALTFHLKIHVFFLISVPVFLVILEIVKKYAVSEKVTKLIRRFKLAMLFSVIMAVSALVLSGPAKQTVELTPASFFEQAE